jgi:DNA (cytosine-5)-methyltransferase 1
MTRDNPFQVLDLFSGIGGFSLGLERAGMETVAFCEQDGYACRVLRKHWPTIPIFEDVRTLTAKRLRAHGINPTIVCGGFPCQDISTAGKGAGIDGERSGLWTELARLIREIRPLYAVVENVPALRSRGLNRVLGDLASIGFDAEWHCIPASALGAPHQRDRVWIIAHPTSRKVRRLPGRSKAEIAVPGIGSRDAPILADAYRHGFHRPRLSTSREVSHADAWPRRRWTTESPICRMDDGIPDRVDRLRCLGNAVVPQVVEMIGRAIVQHHRALEAEKRLAEAREGRASARAS